MEQDTGIQTFASSSTPSYIETGSLNNQFTTAPEVETFLHRACMDKRISVNIGYPVLLKKLYSARTGKYFYMVAPVFLYSIDKTTQEPNITSMPKLNIEVVKYFSNNDANEVIYDLIELENELGLNASDTDYIEIDDLTARLQAIRNWTWVEEIDPDNICCKPPLRELTEEGIYNHAIVITSERSLYTEGLEVELSQLSEVEVSSYKDTALYKWLYDQNSDADISAIDDDLDILEVLPLNTEQEKAVKQAFYSDLTVITGPPGTGKSQVVTDLLINAAWKNKSVLFASKNNKAVDVVDFRINGLTQRPVMVRLGSNSNAQRLAELVESLLNSIENVNAQSEYNHYKKLYDDKQLTIKKLKEEKDAYILMRNTVDRLEQKYSFIREKCSNFFDCISDYDITIFDAAENQCYKDYHNAQKDEQSFFTKLFWPLNSASRYEAYNNSARKLNVLLSKYQLSNVGTNAKAYSKTFFQQKMQEIDDMKTNLHTIVEYKDTLQTFTNMRPLPDIDKELFDNRKGMSDLAIFIWNSWLSTQRLEITQKQRQEMLRYITAMELQGSQKIRPRSDLQQQFNKLQVEMTKLLPCWAVTSLSAKGRVPLTPALFDLVIIDEASQCDIASVIPLLYRAKHAVIIGDPKQLSHISSIPKNQDYNLINKYNIPLEWAYSVNSLYSIASGKCDANKLVRLLDHHRSVKEIIDFSNHEFYDGSLRIATDYKRLKPPTNTKPGIRWINVNGKTERPATGGAFNNAEVKFVINELKDLIARNYKGSIGVVTPFRSQATHIREAIASDPTLECYLQSNNDFLVDTVHKFQGDERDLIIFSTVISQGSDVLPIK